MTPEILEARRKLVTKNNRELAKLRSLTDEQKAELQSGDGYYYVTQGVAGHAGEWPDVVRHPTDRMLCLVKRQAGIKPLEYAQTGREPNEV
jgi:hypothetical protein